MKVRTGAPYCTRALARAFPILCAGAALVTTASAQDPLQRYPQNYRLVFDNPQVAVIRVHYGPEESIGVHDHSDVPTLFVYLNDSGAVRFRQVGLPPSTNVRPPARAGSFRFSPGRVERHTAQNLGNGSSEFLRIEFKQFPLTGGEAFRQNAPAALSSSGDAQEFGNDETDVDRVVCVAGQNCAIPADANPSVIVALSAMRLMKPDMPAEDVEAGGVRWIGPNRSFEISADGSAPAHVLRISVKSPRQAGPVD